MNGMTFSTSKYRETRNVGKEITLVASMTGVSGLWLGTWLATATVVVQLLAAVVAVGVGIVTGLYYYAKWKQVKNGP